MKKVLNKTDEEIIREAIASSRIPMAGEQVTFYPSMYTSHLDDTPRRVTIVDYIKDSTGNITGYWIEARFGLPYSAAIFVMAVPKNSIYVHDLDEAEMEQIESVAAYIKTLNLIPTDYPDNADWYSESIIRLLKKLNDFSNYCVFRLEIELKKIGGEIPEGLFD